MDSWTARKRPWEEDSPIEYQSQRRDATTAAGELCAPPLPQHAGQYSRDSQTLSQRRLPPLYTPSCSTPAEPLQSTSLHRSPSVQDAGELGNFRPRSQSLFDVFQQSKRPRHDLEPEPQIAISAPLNLDRSLPPIGTDTHRTRFGTDPAPHAAGGSCCPSTCTGQACSNTRTLMRKLASELILLDTKVRSISQKGHDSSHSSYNPPEFEHTDTGESLEWALNLIRWANLSLREHFHDRVSRSPEETPYQLDTSPTMRRGQHPFEREDRSPPTRQSSGPMHGYSGFANPVTMAPDESRRHLYSSDNTPMANSPHHTASSAGSMFLPPQSPMQAPQPSRSSMLPSPSSMNFPNVQNLPPISPPSTSLQTAAQAAHLQDLQHQVSIKTLAFQTLQREYDSLLQKLERQRTKCATLEKKFEVSDVEINTLTDEKEKLQATVANLESQVEDLQQSRDEARRQLVANGAQYMRIMEMANRLQAQSADDKKRWDAERQELEHRIRVLEEAMVTGATDRSNSRMDEDIHTNPPPSIIEAHRPNLNTPSSTSTETVNVLRAEISRLRSRTQTLETALQSMKKESISIQAAAKQLVESGGKMERVASEITGGQK
ncbi:hypothetical protein BDV96DRAFT_222141 [Lophiotrema nucula]|uniref:Uncharacterized protein n=1 Tax=Lophiotrema nucula TaxID=690887 RepID=A0A6A5YUE3_9PLEO|nr:hypothetical protein BDV96DRAFT_222141 [Lophiotrema nucula]